MQALIAAMKTIDILTEASGVRWLWTSKDKEEFVLMYKQTLCRIRFVSKDDRITYMRASKVELPLTYGRLWSVNEPLLKDLLVAVFPKLTVTDKLIESCVMLTTTQLDMIGLTDVLKLPEDWNHGCSDGKDVRPALARGPCSYTMGEGYFPKLLDHLCDIVDWATKQAKVIYIMNHLLLFPKELTEEEQKSGILLTTLPILDGWCMITERRQGEPLTATELEERNYRELYGWLVTCRHGNVSIELDKQLNWLQAVVHKADLPLLSKLQAKKEFVKRSDVVCDKDAE